MVALLRSSLAVRLCAAAFLFVLVFGGGSILAAVEHPYRDISVEKKPNQAAGKASVIFEGKIKVVSSRVFEAWPVEDGQNAVILIETAKGVTDQSTLRFYEGATRKWRDLGTVPFIAATLIAGRADDGTLLFVLTGMDHSRSLVIVADEYAIRARLPHASSPELRSRALTYLDNETKQKQSIPVSDLVAADLADIYQVNDRYVQFLRNSTAIITKGKDSLETGKWWTDGYSMFVAVGSRPPEHWPRESLKPVAGVPATTRLIVRLTEPLSSWRAKADDQVKAILISPALIKDRIYLPQGAEFTGHIAKAHGVGWGIRHETATLTLDFTETKLPDGRTLDIQTQLNQVDNSREKVEKGAIKGILSTGTLAHSAESKVASVAALDPVAYLFATVSATSALGFAEPEILYPAGTELELQFTAPLVTAATYPQTIPGLASNRGQGDQLLRFVRQLPFRTMTQGTNKPSDITNLIFVGPLDGLRRAFQAAGWKRVDELNANTTFKTLQTIGGNKTYNEAPMSTLLLDERPPILNLSKTTNTFSSRHHLRIFDADRKYDGATVLTSSSTQDIGIAFSREKRTFIHVIDQYIDNERAKVVNDLEFTGCVSAASLVPRPWVPQDALNSTGDRLRTDGSVAVLKLTDCLNPRTTSSDNAVPPNRFQRIVRDTNLTLRNDVYRGNLGYQAVSGSIWLKRYLATRNKLQPQAGNWQKTDASGAEFKGASNLSLERQPAVRIEEKDEPDRSSVTTEEAVSHRWDPPRFEIGIDGGYQRYPTLRTDVVGILLTPESSMPNLPVKGVGLADVVNGGWTVGINVTANTWKWVSNKFSYHYQHGHYDLAAFSFQGDGDPNIKSDGAALITRQFEYNALINLRPPSSRWRPYVAAGPALQLISLGDAPLKGSSRTFRLGLQNIGVLKAAFDFGSTPPLEGGGIFQLGLVYGAGIKFRVHPRITLSTDFRETWSKNPEFIRDSYTDGYFDLENYDADYQRIRGRSKFRQQRFTFGIAYTF